LNGFLYEQRRDELLVQVIPFEKAGQTEEREYFPVKARYVATEWEVRQRKAKLEKHTVRRLSLLFISSFSRFYTNFLRGFNSHSAHYNSSRK
jgi:hypothetical protein